MKYLLYILIQLSVFPIASAEIYKCNNDNKQITYTDRPCVATKSEILSIHSLPISLATKKSVGNKKKQLDTPFLSAPERALLQKIGEQEQHEEKFNLWKEKQHFKLNLKQATKRAKRKETRKKKCRKHKKRLKKLQNKARNGYKVSESNNLFKNIRRLKKSVGTYCY